MLSRHAAVAKRVALASGATDTVPELLQGHTHLGGRHMQSTSESQMFMLLSVLGFWCLGCAVLSTAL